MEPGRHQINFQVMDRNGNIQTGFTSHEFEIILPWHEDFRLTVIVGFGGMMMLFFIGLSYRKHHQLVHSYSQVEQKVTERTHELERANQALLHSQKMQALGTLAAGIAHDFNNILSIIKGSAQLIENDPDQSIKAKTRLNRINTVVDQGTTLVQSLLGFCRSDPTHTTDLDLEKIIRDTVNLLGDRYLHKVDIVFDIPSDLMTVRSSKDLIQQILLNLVMNAVDSIKDRGCITFQAENLNKLPEDMVWRPLSTPPYVLISIADTGGGIASDIRPRIFEPFFTTKSFSTRRGTGLGLSMVYKLAEEMDIGIVVQSEIGKGSTFSIVIPRSSDTASNQISS
jgi:signal transduction histidine kinase